MSWAEDSGMYDYCGEDYEDREDEWKRGIHTDRDGNEHQISEMETSYLMNVIKYFKDYDVSPLTEELKKRNLNLNPK
jgi:hypothetical protein